MEKLEADPDLAAPWHQLFKQVQSPRHLLSELLQNADDAGATEAFANIEEDVFTFRHNGEDFKEEHFQSLCRFGYSNKRALHTIGFRGIGFKSTFSVGDRVEIRTRTLNVAFDRKRFTAPIWDGSALRLDHWTEVRIPISSAQRAKELQKNLIDWMFSPVSLLFFRHIRRLNLLGQDLHWGSLGSGPVENAEWMALHDKPDEPVLLVKSGLEPFPSEALAEIKNERLLNTEEDFLFPPCQIEVVLGTAGRLYVVLPTGVSTNLPFACNAPFLQDPARLKIKELEISPTNRWLLARAGQLAGDVMLKWLGSTSSVKDRAGAYDLLPGSQASDRTLEGQVTSEVTRAFNVVLEDVPFVLTELGTLVEEGEAVALPTAVTETWEEPATLVKFDALSRPSLSQFVSDQNITKLVDRDAVDSLSRSSVALRLCGFLPPQPKSWRKLLGLWAYLGPDLTGYWNRQWREDVAIVPVQGEDRLYPAKDVTRIGEKRMLQSETDWTFLSLYVRVLNTNWSRFLATQRRLAEENDDQDLKRQVEVAYNVFKALGFEATSDADKVVQQVGSTFFGSKRPMQEAVQLTQIAATLSANVGEEFQYWTKDGSLRNTSHRVVALRNPQYEYLIAAKWAEAHLLEPSYTQFASCTEEEWLVWAYSDKSRLAPFVLLSKSEKSIWGRAKIAEKVRQHGFQGDLIYPYTRDNFTFTDWDFDAIHWTHWDQLATEDEFVWCDLIEQIAQLPEQYVTSSANAQQVATTGNKKTIASGLSASWLLRFRNLPCLRDTHGRPSLPESLMLRTVETEPFRDVEPFVKAALDNERTRKLLDALGVRSAPLGPDKILERLRALSGSENPPVAEVEKWYRRLDEIASSGSTTALESLRKAFGAEPLILTDDLQWTTVQGVFSNPDETEAPGLPVIRKDVSALALWSKIGVEPRPSVELALQWLNTLPSGQVLEPAVSKRARALIKRYPHRVWNECGHWVSLTGSWVATANLNFSVSMQSLVKRAHLHDWLRDQTADLTELPSDDLQSSPFAQLTPLASVLEEKVVGQQGGEHSESKEWIVELGNAVARLAEDDSDQITELRELGSRLASTGWVSVEELETMPYLEGTPAGTSSYVDVLWQGSTLFVVDKPLVRIARAVAAELSRYFRRPDFGDAVKICIDRPGSFVRSYMEANFTLLEQLPLTSNGPAQAEPTHPIDVVLDEPIDGSQEATIETSSPEPTELEAESEEDVVEGDVSTKGRKARASHAPKPSLIEVFAAASGFRKVSDGRFVRESDGHLLLKDPADEFPWQHVDTAGSVIIRFLPIQVSPERSAIDLEASVWRALEQQPDRHGIILPTPAGSAVALTGTKMLDQRERGLLKLYPSTYRVTLSLSDN